MKKRILSFALAFVFCFCCLGTIGLVNDGSQLHADVAQEAQITSISTSGGKFYANFTRVNNYEYATDSAFANKITGSSLEVVLGGTYTIYSKVGSLVASKSFTVPSLIYTAEKSGTNAVLSYTLKGGDFGVSGVSISFKVVFGTTTFGPEVKSASVSSGQTLTETVTIANIGTSTDITYYYDVSVTGTVTGNAMTLVSVQNQTLSKGIVKHDSTTHIYSCPICGSCTTPNCENYIGCNGVATGCQKPTSGSTIKHTIDHTVCATCKCCTVANCEYNKYGCTATMCKDPSNNNVVIKSHTVANVLSTACPTCTKVNWGSAEWTNYPCDSTANTTGATCKYTCQSCKKGVLFVTWDASECPVAHSYGTRTQSSGVWVEYCEYCNAVQFCKNQTPCGHDESLYTLVKTNTDCEIAGVWTYKCSACSQTITKTHSVSAHTWDAGVVTTAAGAVTDGVRTYTCTTCGKTKTEAIPMTNPCLKNGHTYGEWLVVTEATCTADGSRSRTCSVCQNVETEAIQAIGHTYGTWVTATAATCTTNGMQTMTCSKCHDVQTRTIAATGHTYGAWETVTAPTCIATGEEKQVCTKCNDTVKRSIAATGIHSFASDSTSSGLMHCVNCSFTYSVVHTDTGATRMVFTSNGATLSVPTISPNSLQFETEKKSEAAYTDWLNVLKNAEAISEDALFCDGYAVSLTNADQPVDMNALMEISLTIPADIQKKNVKVYALTANGSLTSVSDVEREGTSVVFAADSSFTGEFFLVADKSSANPAIPIIAGIVAVVAIAGIGGSILYKKGFFSI